MKRITLTGCISLLALSVSFLSGATGQPEGLKPEQCLGGGLNAPIRLEVFSDFECPACREFYLQTIRPVLKEYSSLDKVCVIYHEFPLPGHKYSHKTAQYSKAAQRLGRKQWAAVLDALYEKQPQWLQDGKVDDVVFEALGSDDYFNVRRLILDPAIDNAITEEIAAGQKKDVTSTPTFFVSAIGREQKVVGGVPYPVLKGYFDSIVK